MDRVYVDTNIFLDFWLDRMSGLNPANQYAGEFFKNCLRCLHKIVISENVLFEFRKNFPARDIETRLEPFKKLNKLEIVSLLKEDIVSARHLSSKKKIPFHDAVHAVIARRLGIPIITRDKHFSELKDLITVLTPEEL